MVKGQPLSHPASHRVRMKVRYTEIKKEKKAQRQMVDGIIYVKKSWLEISPAKARHL